MARDRKNNRNRSNDRDDKGKVTFTNVASLWRTRKGSEKVIASGTLNVDDIPSDHDGELKVLFMKNDKGDNQKRPDFRLVVVQDEDDEGDGKENRRSSKKDDNDPPF